VVGRPGAHMPRRPAPPWRCPVCQVSRPRHRSMGATPQALSSVDPMSVCTDGHDGVVLDPWVHCHGLGALQPTLELPYRPNLHTCCLYNHLWGPTKALRSKGSEIKGRPTPYLRRLAPHFHSTTSPLDTCKETHLGATWCIHLWLFHWWFDPRARRGCHADRGCGDRVAPTPP